MAGESIKVYNNTLSLEQFLNRAESLPEVKLFQAQQETLIPCGLIDFEGLGNFLPIPPQNLGFTTATFAPEWFSAIQSSSGGSANFDNLPSPITQAGSYSNSSDIFLSNPVSSVSLFYSSVTGVTLEVFDIDGTLLSLESGPANYQFPNTIWNQLKINVGSNKISKITIIGGSLAYGIDNLQLCVATRGLFYY